MIEKAKESTEAARSLAKDGHYDFAALRAYYAMFYVAGALLAQLGHPTATLGRNIGFWS